MSVTDLVMLDIKHINDEEHQKLTGQPNSNILAFAKYLDSIGKPVWIRHVVVPGITFDEKELMELGLFLKTLRNVENWKSFHIILWERSSTTTLAWIMS